MAVITIPGTATEQYERTQGQTTSGKSFTRSWKDSYNTLAALSVKLGEDTVDGLVVTNAVVRRVPGDCGVLTLTLSNESTTGGQSSVVNAQRAVWTCKTVRNDVSILAYCGGAASRVNLELWMKETDAALADANTFHKNEVATDVLNSQEIAIADKIRKGIDSVVRFYPVLTCTSTWARIPSTFLRLVGFRDTPGAPSADEVQAPSNLSSVIDAYDWLKVQDDVTEPGNGKWQRIESWMGVDGRWDEELYGTNRWPMPLSSAGGS